jgi:hypothetical protein
MCEPTGRSCVLYAFAIGVLLSIGSSGHAQEVAPAAKTATTEQRLKAVEDKTSFYVKTTKKILQTYKKGRAASAPWQCVGNTMVLVTDPKITMGGTSYSWTTMAAKFNALGLNPSLTLSIGIYGKPGCLLASAIDSSGGTYKNFCQPAVEPGDKFQFTLSLSNEPDGELRACDHVTSINLELKLVNVGIEEPK